MDKTAKYTVFLVDDHQLFIDGMCRILEDNDDIEIKGIFNSGDKVFCALHNYIPSLIILDIQMCGKNGIDLCKEIKHSYPQIKILFVSMFDDTSTIHSCKLAGANGFIPKTSDASTVKNAITTLLCGKELFCDNYGYANEQLSHITYPHLLSKREVEIIQQIKKGLTSKMIARQLHISNYTVETHRKNIFKKLNISSVSELIIFAYQHQL